MRFKRSKIRQRAAGDAALKSAARSQAHVKNNPGTCWRNLDCQLVVGFHRQRKKSGAALLAAPPHEPSQ
jgi:hypothetical protein